MLHKHFSAALTHSLAMFYCCMQCCAALKHSLIAFKRDASWKYFRLKRDFNWSFSEKPLHNLFIFFFFFFCTGLSFTCDFDLLWSCVSMTLCGLLRWSKAIDFVLWRFWGTSSLDNDALICSFTITSNSNGNKSY